ncbi:MAG: mannose-1-phosphate guanylyltransferase/mannose-6-phosphate isomerase [Rickettsiales bacterium]|nr:mannose-1-phosphate guanylyltransferase/mannose-6-phosphate isomerase [Rickettsiales bacterium]
MKITPVILSGGSGTRLWPLSRSLNPKQFLNLVDENSLFQKTALRTKNEEIFHNPIIICNNEHRFIAAEELQKIDVTPKLIILEPIAKNTAPAITIAAINAVENKSDDLILVMPSDHIIKDEENFIKNVKAATKAAKEGYLITFGIVANRPETGFGYIKSGEKLTTLGEIFTVEKFIEKPEKSVAENFLKQGGYFWNSGIFMFRASSYLEILRQLENNIFIHCCGAYNKAIKDLDFVRLSAEDFEKCPSISVDYAVMEKADKVAVVPINVGWSDVGNWQALSEISAQDKDGNSLIGDVVTLRTKDCYINSKNSLVTTIGIENLIIVALKDVILIANKNNAQDVKELFEILKKNKRAECDSHTKVLRPWGSFETIDISDRFKVKRITVKPKSALSLQMHNHRAEHWVVVKGTAHVTCGSKEFILTEDESTYIPIGKKHRLENKGQIPLELIEVQTGNYLGEDDIIRFSDIYGR